MENSLTQEKFNEILHTFFGDKYIDDGDRFLGFIDILNYSSFPTEIMFEGVETKSIDIRVYTNSFSDLDLNVQEVAGFIKGIVWSVLPKFDIYKEYTLINDSVVSLSFEWN